MLTLVILLALTAALICLATTTTEGSPNPGGPEASLGKVKAEVGFVHTGALKPDKHKEVDKSKEAHFGFSMMPEILTKYDELMEGLRAIDKKSGHDYHAEVTAIVRSCSGGKLKVQESTLEHVQIGGLWLTNPLRLYVVTDNGGIPVELGRVWAGKDGTSEKGVFSSHLLILVRE